MANIDVSIIFVNYKTSNLVGDVINSIKEKSNGFSYELIAVDNSKDEEELARLKLIEGLTVIDANGNLGFGRANNLGANVAKGKYLYFLNTDTLLINNAIYELKNFLDDNPNVSIVGSNLYTKENKPNHSFIKIEKNVKNEKKINSPWIAIKKRITHKSPDFNYSNNPLKIDGYVCGASLMMRRGDFAALGGFDKDIFMYAEESLLCYRAIHELHKEVYNVPTSRIIHFEGGSFKKPISYNRIKTNIDGNVVYYTKAFGKAGAVDYLKGLLKTSKKKKLISTLIFNKRQIDKFKLYVQACNEKLKEIANE